MAPSLDKIVMVVGETGAGKSTLINMMYNNDWSEDCCREPCNVGSTAASVTKASNMYVNIMRKWCFLDTVGIGDPEFTEAELIGAIRSLLCQAGRGVDCVMFVVKMGRVPMATRANLLLLQKVFYESDLRRNGVLVLTHWEGDLGNEQADLESWLTADEEMKRFVKMFGAVVMTENKLGRGAYPECRRECLMKLNTFAMDTPGRIFVRPVNLYELLADILRRFAGVLWKRIVYVSDLKSMILSNDNAQVPVYCGNCTICLEPIEFEQAAYLKCGHAFHEECLRMTSAAGCPNCRQPYTGADVFRPSGSVM